MKLEVFHIQFGNTNGVFIAGEQLKGRIILKLKNSMKVKKIFICFDGQAKTCWEVNNGHSKTHYTASECYLNETIVLLDGGSAGEDLQPGEHSYVFSLVLGTALPCSFEGRRGHVRYFCKASIVRPWKFDEHTRRVFSLNRPLDLNNDPTALMPMWAEQEEVIDGYCCSSGNVKASLTLAKKGHVPGEPIIYSIDIINKSDHSVEHMDLDLKQVVSYSGYSKSMFSSGHPKEHVIVEKFSLLSSHKKVKSNTEEHLHRSTPVPALPPSYLDGCGIIRVSYCVELKVKVRRSYISINHGILIGTVPLAFPAMPMADPLRIAADQNAVPSDPLVAYPPDYEPPPSYEESVFGRVEIRDENDDTDTSGVMMSWAPSYPVYHYDAAARHFQIVSAPPSTNPTFSASFTSAPSASAPLASAPAASAPAASAPAAFLSPDCQPPDYNVL